MTFDAWKEQLILEKYYAPMLRIGHGLSPEERRLWDRRRPRPDPHEYWSPADNGRVFVRPSKPVFWTGALLGVLLLLAAPTLAQRLRDRGSDPGPG